jgi:hypothetical protein
MTGQNSITIQMTLQMAHRILHRITRRIMQMNLFKINSVTLLATVSYPPDLETQSQAYQYTLPIVHSQILQPIYSQALQLHARKSWMD